MDRLDEIDEALTTITLRKSSTGWWTLHKIEFNGYAHAVSEKEMTFMSDDLAKELEELYTDLGLNVDVVT